jgi:SAM-dependent methyltransferase
VENYTATAEFYDLLQATQHLALAKRLARRWLGRPAVGVLDVGAGTGLATAMLAHVVQVPVHAIEPAAPMRSVLLSRLAGRPELLAHVRVHARPVQELDLRGVADAALCLNTMGCLDSAERAAALAAIRTALVPGAVLIVQRPPDAVGPERRPLPAWHLGGDVYGGEVLTTPEGSGRVRWSFVYRVRRGSDVLREVSEDFTGYLTALDDFVAELGRAGFAPTAADEPDIVIAYAI